LVVFAGYQLWPKGGAPSLPVERLSVTEILADTDTSGFARAVAPRRFVFPDDHGPHPEFKTEWWYYTGNLVSESGERFGFQLTFFRSALSPPAAGGGPVKGGGASAAGSGAVSLVDDGAASRRWAESGETVSHWRTNQIYMAHFALSDISRGEFYAVERFSRAANGLAGAQAKPFRVRLEEWHAESISPGDRPMPSMHLYAGENGIAIDLRIVNAKKLVLQGDDGLSRKGDSPGNASYYYSATRLAVDGLVRTPDQESDVSGTAWLDREWSTSALEQGQVGWDWFALQLGDGTEIMYYQIRRDDGTADRNSHGAYIDREGGKSELLPEDVTLEVLGRWESPRGGMYPSEWRLAIPGERLELAISPSLADQELDLSFRYWEGAVRVTGTRAGHAIDGYGYVELTGYAE
jgi:predicted secreted hydrolase